MIGIYKIINPEGKIYIGCTINWERRLHEYKNLKVKGQSLIYNSLIKFGWINHKFELIEECSIEQLYEKEIYWIYQFDSVEKGLNIRLGGRNGHLAQSTKDKIGKALKGRKNTWSKKGGGPFGQKLNHGKKIGETLKEHWKTNKKIGPQHLCNKEIAEEIRIKYKTGDFTRSDLAREYGVSWGTIKNITDKINSYKDIIG